MAIAFFVLVVCLPPCPAKAAAGFDDDRVMLQGFYWESYRHGHQPKFIEYGTKHWYAIVKEQADGIRDGRFDLIWLPPPSFAGEYSAGYDPREYFNFSNSYGSLDEHRSLLEALLNRGVEPIADLVLNHRNGLHHWADFKNPDWGTWAICRGDECFDNPASEVRGTPENQRGAPEEFPEYAGHGGTTYAYGDFRDIDHTNQTVRRDIIRYLLGLKSLGYRGWRYDMVHGYHARWIALYNRRTQPTFSVGEYDWGQHAAQRGWVWNTATTPSDLHTASSVFDFSTKFALQNHEAYTAWSGYGNGTGMIGDTTDGQPWKNRAVTFLENHDTGYRTNEDGSPQADHKFDTFANNWEAEQGYAYILTHPGVPCVYWKHYFDWGSELREKIKALINARKIAGVKSGSALHVQLNALAKGVYAAMVEGANGQLYVRIGGNDDSWQPWFSDYKDYQEYAHGAGWRVWVKLPGNPAVQWAQPKPALPVPDYKNPNEITIPDDWAKP